MRKKGPQIYIKPYAKKKKSRFKKVFFTLLLVLLGLTCSVFLTLNFLIKKEMEEVEKLKRENVYYEGEIKRLTSSDEPYEEILRTKYGYIKEGERIIIYSSSQAKEGKKP
ncbi:FtsB family cell division protein [Thermodesulfobacterium hveragerdense]|uniref:FtsB family cell division protein n=1 Tax=Thermodesulfobacterium hveragerdense TaxID=53424 RepID=UPI00048E01C1|nr:septum formation initiator family protein [Thermodesulfobacterium hveragerdense]